MSLWTALFEKKSIVPSDRLVEVLSIFQSIPAKESMMDVGKSPFIFGPATIGNWLPSTRDAIIVHRARIEIEEFTIKPMGKDTIPLLETFNYALKRTRYWNYLQNGNMLISDLDDGQNPQRSAAFKNWEQHFGFGQNEHGQLTLRLPTTMQIGTIPAAILPPRKLPTHAEIFDQIHEAIRALTFPSR